MLSEKLLLKKKKILTEIRFYSRAAIKRQIFDNVNHRRKYCGRKRWLQRDLIG